MVNVRFEVRVFDIQCYTHTLVATITVFKNSSPETIALCPPKFLPLSTVKKSKKLDSCQVQLCSIKQELWRERPGEDLNQMFFWQPPLQSWPSIIPSGGLEWCSSSANHSGCDSRQRPRPQTGPAESGFTRTHIKKGGWNVLLSDTSGVHRVAIKEAF